MTPPGGGSATPDPPKPRGCQTPGARCGRARLPGRGPPGPCAHGGNQAPARRENACPSRVRGDAPWSSPPLSPQPPPVASRWRDRRPLHRAPSPTPRRALRLPGRHADELRHQHQGQPGSGAARRARRGRRRRRRRPVLAADRRGRRALRPRQLPYGREGQRQERDRIDRGHPDRFRHRGHPRGNPDPVGTGRRGIQEGRQEARQR